MRNWTILLAALLAGSGVLLAQAPAAGGEDIQKMLRERIDQDQPGVGMVVGILDEKGSRIIVAGEADEKHRALDGATVFEIGSATKAFNAILLADLVTRKVVKLDDPVRKYLPANVQLPDWQGKPITLLDLATHTSGLPRLPGNLMPKDPSNPYADYTVAQLYEFLGGCKLTSEPGTKYAYSNLGAGLLGHVIALQAGADYETVMKKRLLQPLRMDNSGITLTPTMAARLTPGHDAGGKRVANWDLPTLAGAGALRSCADDLLKFVAANLAPGTDGLGPALKLAQERQKDTGMPDLAVGLGWHLKNSSGDTLVWHNGETGGYHSFIGLYPKAKRAVVILFNKAQSIDDIGFHLLDPRLPLPPTKPVEAKPRKEIKMARELLLRYVGRYEITAGVAFIIRLEGDQLSAQLTGQGVAEIYPETEKEFFYKIVDAQLSFQTDAQGQVSGLVLHQNGRDVPAKKTSSEVPAPRQEIQVEAAILDRYVGTYELVSGFQMVFTREGGQLMAQATGQPKFPVFASSPVDFFFKVAEASLTFVVDPATGKATGFVLHQDGDHPAKKVH